jgi:hypothetical protein
MEATLALYDYSNQLLFTLFTFPVPPSVGSKWQIKMSQFSCFSFPGLTVKDDIMGLMKLLTSS